ncbi:MAG: PilN domain-containing protein [Deltaproteobacteria bacterium]|nr:PilN domain-containing protein [Deltaproteobacteria bacterium]
MIKINLLPVRLAKKKENIRKQLSVCLLSVFFIVLAMAYLGISFSYQIKSLTDDIGQVQNEIGTYNKVVQGLEEQKKQKDLIQKKLDVLGRLQRNKTGPVHMLDEISTKLPEKRLWLKAIKQNENKLLLEGVAMDNGTVALYMKSLAASPYFTNVDLINSAQETVKGVKLMQFSITCEIKGISVDPSIAEQPADKKKKGEKKA